MKTFFALLTALVLLAGLACAAAIDGKWVAEQKMNRGGQEMTMVTTFDLKADGAALTGTVTSPGRPGSEPVPVKITDGKIDGNKFSFVIVRQGPNGEVKLKYEGTVEGDTLKGTMTREGGQGQARPFEAKKQ